MARGARPAKLAGRAPAGARAAGARQASQAPVSASCDPATGAAKGRARKGGGEGYAAMDDAGSLAAGRALPDAAGGYSALLAALYARAGDRVGAKKRTRRKMDKLLAKYVGREAPLFGELEKKYGVARAAYWQGAAGGAEEREEKAKYPPVAFGGGTAAPRPAPAVAPAKR